MAWRTGQIDPKATFRVGPVNGRKAPESGLWRLAVRRILFPPYDAGFPRALGQRQKCPAKIPAGGGPAPPSRPSRRAAPAAFADAQPVADWVLFSRHAQGAKG